MNDPGSGAAESADYADLLSEAAPCFPEPPIVYGDSSSNDFPLVSMAKSQVIKPPISAMTAKVINTKRIPKPLTIKPTISGPMEDPARSHALE